MRPSPGDVQGEADGPRRPLLFSYGSNMCRERLRDRAPSARIVGPAVLEGRELRFHKASDVDGSGKADAYPTDDRSERVWGVLARLSGDDAERMDAFEGVGSGYRIEEVAVREPDGRVRGAYLYRAEEDAVEPGLRPFAWYLRLVVAGARQHGLPADYVRALERRPAEVDPDRERARKHLSVLDDGGAGVSLSGARLLPQVAPRTDRARVNSPPEAGMGSADDTPGAGRAVPSGVLTRLAATLRALEGRRQGQVDAGAAASQARSDLDDLRELVAGTDPARLPEGLGDALERARQALEGSEVDEARETLLEVGRRLDDHLRD